MAVVLAAMGLLAFLRSRMQKFSPSQDKLPDDRDLDQRDAEIEELLREDVRRYEGDLRELAHS